jgi:hypothetical protein
LLTRAFPSKSNQAQALAPLLDETADAQKLEKPKYSQSQTNIDVLAS